jgi:hypothetical protein
MKVLLGFAAALGTVSAQYSTGDNGNASLPVVDLGYEMYRASGYNVGPAWRSSWLEEVLTITQDTGRFYNFSNIRYAAPPIGNLRFALPEAPVKNRSSINDGGVGRYA